MGHFSTALAGAAGLILALWPQLAHTQEPQSSSKSDLIATWTGVSGGVDSIYAYAGSAIALNGDLDAIGFLARIGFGGGAYRTEGNDPHDVIQYDANLMLGYRAHTGQSVFAFYVGADASHHDNKDRGAKPRGTEFGAKGLFEAYLPLGDRFYLDGFGTYSTAFDTYATNAKLAWRLTETFSFGPEAGAVGSAGFSQARIGLAAALHLGEDTELAASAGSGWDLDDNDIGIYGGINLYTEF